MPVLFKNQSVLLKDFFNQQEDEPLKGISHKNILIKKNIIAYMALNGESTLADLARELHVSVPTITKLVGELVEENIVVDNGKIETAGGLPSQYLRAGQYGHLFRRHRHRAR